MLDQKKAELIETEVERVTKQKADKPHTTFSKVLSESIIIYKEIDKRTKEYKIGFTYEAFFEYVIARYFLNNYSSLDNEGLLLKFKDIVETVQSFRNLMGAIEYIVLLLEDAKIEDADGEVYVKMLELLSTYKDKSLRNEAIIIIKKLKHILKNKNTLKMLADDDNLAINRDIYTIFIDNYQKFDVDFQRDMLSIISTKGNNQFLQNPIDFILKFYKESPPQIQDLLVYFSHCDFINTKRTLSHVISIPWRELPPNIYETIVVNLVKEKDKLIMHNIITSLSVSLSLLEKENRDIILSQLIKNENIDLKELSKLLEDNANLISDTVLKEFIDWSLEHGDEWTRLKTVFTMKKLIEQGSIVIDFDYTNLIKKLTSDTDENISQVAKDYLVRGSKKNIVS